MGGWVVESFSGSCAYKETGSLGSRLGALRALSTWVFDLPSSKLVGNPGTLLLGGDKSPK